MLYEILILLTSIPLGYLLAFLTKEELVISRKYHLILIILSLISIPITFLINIAENMKLTIIYTLLYIALATSVSLYKSYDRKFVK